MQSSRILNLPIPPVVPGNENRIYLHVKCEDAFLAAGGMKVAIDLQMISKAYKEAIKEVQ